MALCLCAHPAASGSFIVSPGDNTIILGLEEPGFNTTFTVSNNTFADFRASAGFVAFNRFVLSLRSLDGSGVRVDVLGAESNLTVDVDSSSASVLWVIGGFAPVTNVTVYDDGVAYDTYESNSSGYLSFTNSPVGVFVFAENQTFQTTTTTLAGGGNRRTTTTTTTTVTTSTQTSTTSTGTIPVQKQSASEDKPGNQTRQEEEPTSGTLPTGGEEEEVKPNLPELKRLSMKTDEPSSVRDYVLVLSVMLILALVAVAAGLVFILGKRRGRPPRTIRTNTSRLGSV